jgi:hypothetical protein
MTKPKTNKDYEKLGRIVTSVYETGYLNAHQQYKNAFLKGMIGAVGGVLGATIGIALLLWLLSLFVDAPLIGNYFKEAQDTIKNSRN